MKKYPCIISDNLAKSRFEAPRWLDKKFDMQGVEFWGGVQQYIRYVECLPKTYNEGDRTFCDAIITVCCLCAVVAPLEWMEYIASARVPRVLPYFHSPDMFHKSRSPGRFPEAMRRHQGQQNSSCWGINPPLYQACARSIREVPHNG